MKAGTESKLKFATLKRLLGLPLWQVIGVLETLWRVTQINAPAGDIGKLTDEEIAAGMEWAGPPEPLINALIEARWIDRDEQFRLIIHDWSEHAPNHLLGAFKKHGKQFADQLAKQRREQPAREDAQAPCLSTLPSTMPPSQAKPSLTKPPPAKPEANGQAGLAGGGDLDSWENQDTKTRATLALRDVKYARVEPLLIECQKGGIPPSSVVRACQEFTLNRSKFDGPGAIAEFLRSGVWPANGVVPVGEKKVSPEKRKLAIEGLRRRLKDAGVKDVGELEESEIINRAKERQMI